MTIGEKLLELRKEKSLSQEEVANQVNVSRQTISKWETDQSLPDFDKIVPLCNLYGITTDELLKGEKKSSEIENEVQRKQQEQKSRIKTAAVVSVSVLLYFVGGILVALADYIGIHEDLMVCISLGICAIATCLLIFHFMSLPDKEERQKKKEENQTVKMVIEITGLVFAVIYFWISFMTMAWGITWIIWIIYAIVEQIIRLCFRLAGGEKNEK